MQEDLEIQFCVSTDQLGLLYSVSYFFTRLFQRQVLKTVLWKASYIQLLPIVNSAWPLLQIPQDGGGGKWIKEETNLFYYIQLLSYSCNNLFTLGFPHELWAQGFVRYF